MTERAGLVRYRHIGRVYDVVSMERLLYRTPRRRLLSMIGPMPGATVVDVGCGTGLNLAGLRDLVGLNGRVIGVDSSAGMLAAAERRARRARWANVTLIEGDIADLPTLLEAQVVGDDIDVIVATFVISTLDDDSSFWHVVDRLCAERSLLIALADLGRPLQTDRLRGLALRGLAALGGNHPSSEPWNDLASRSADAHLEVLLGGHVHLAAGHCGPGPTTL